MIRLAFVDLSENEKKSVVKDYADDLLSARRKIGKLDAICKKYKISDSFRELVTKDWAETKKVKQWIDMLTNFTEFNDEVDKVKNYLIDTLYDGIDKLKFVKKLNLSVCPYCNRNFINPSSTGSKCQLDHFFPKSKYPLLAVSFYNLVPSCPACNHAKKESVIGYSPYESELYPDELMKFNFIIKQNITNPKPNDYEVLLESYDIRMYRNIECLDLRDIYQLHTDIIDELMLKARVYDDEYRQELYQRLSDLQISEEKIDRIITGAYTQQEKYGSRPLSKFISDISKKVGLIK